MELGSSSIVSDVEGCKDGVQNAVGDEDKYDRQVRLWGSHGQRCLFEAEVCVLGSSACASETLKNLVLPGIGRFTVVDDARVTESDIGSNFFVTPDDIGKSRAEAVVRLLCELNPDSRGRAIVRDPHSAAADPTFIQQFSLIVAANSPLGTASLLCDVCSAGGISAGPVSLDDMWRPPLLWIRSNGFFASLRVYAECHTVYESHIESKVLPGDLRLRAPFDELKEFCTSVDLEKLDKVQHSHVPFPILVLQALEAYKGQHGGRLPSDYEEYKVVVELLEKQKRNEEVNFDEAMNYVKRMSSSPVVSAPEDCTEVFREARKRSVFAAEWLQEAKRRRPCVPNGKNNNEVNKAAAESVEQCPLVDRRRLMFWVASDSIGRFLETSGELPHDGSLPDMTSDTDTYVALQKIYQKKSREDIGKIIQQWRRRFTTADTGCSDTTGCRVNAPTEGNATQLNACKANDEDEEFVKYLCRHSPELRVIRYPKISAEFDETSTALIDFCKSELSDPESSDDVYWYLAMWAAEKFRARYRRLPGQSATGTAGPAHATGKRYDDVDKYISSSSSSAFLGNEVEKLSAEACVLLKALGVEEPDGSENRKRLQALVSGAGVELHGVCALVGGLAAQEAVKLITSQFVPLVHTYLFNGILSKGHVISF